jgi:hypothetical protein
MDVSPRPCNWMQCNYATNLISWRAAETTGPGPVSWLSQGQGAEPKPITSPPCRRPLVLVRCVPVCTPHPRFKTRRLNARARPRPQRKPTKGRSKKASGEGYAASPKPSYPESRWQAGKIHSFFFPRRCQLRSFVGGGRLKRGAVFRARTGWLLVDWVRRVLGGTCCRFGASLRSCCWWFFSSARWSIGSGSGGMDGNFFGPREQILWPASVLAGILMCGAVSFPRLVPPCFFCFHFTVWISNYQLIVRSFQTINSTTQTSFLLICDRVVVPVAICVQPPQIFHHYTSFFFW